MSRSRISFTDRRRSRLARKAQVERVEPRSLITDPINMFAVSVGIPLVGNLFVSSVGGDALRVGDRVGSGGRARAASTQAMSSAGATPSLPIAIVPRSASGSVAVMERDDAPGAASDSGVLRPSHPRGDWITLSSRDTNPASPEGLTAPSKPAQAATAGVGGGSSVSAISPAPPLHGTISPLRFAPPPSAPAYSAPATPASPPLAKGGQGGRARRHPRLRLRKPRPLPRAHPSFPRRWSSRPAPRAASTPARFPTRPSAPLPGPARGSLLISLPTCWTGTMGP
jgi:hypothetical protein